MRQLLTLTKPQTRLRPVVLPLVTPTWDYPGRDPLSLRDFLVVTMRGIVFCFLPAVLGREEGDEVTEVAGRERGGHGRHRRHGGSDGGDEVTLDAHGLVVETDDYDMALLVLGETTRFQLVKPSTELNIPGQFTLRRLLDLSGAKVAVGERIQFSNFPFSPCQHPPLSVTIPP